jgi:hypothetical protein
MAIGDIVEPNRVWQAFKKQKTGREWDYVFRRLFYTGTPDIGRTDFAAPVEIDSVDVTGGHITNLPEQAKITPIPLALSTQFSTHRVGCQGVSVLPLLDGVVRPEGAARLMWSGRHTGAGPIGQHRHEPGRLR